MSFSYVGGASYILWPKPFKTIIVICFGNSVYLVDFLLCYAMPSLCVCPSVSSWFCTKMAKCSITQTMSHNSPMTLVFWCQRSRRNSNGITAKGVPNAGRVG